LICAIIGAAGHWPYVLQALKTWPDLISQIVWAPGDPREEFPDELAELGARSFPSCQALYSQSGPDIAFINTFVRGQADECINAISRGVSVIAEKPLTSSLDQIQRVRIACSGCERPGYTLFPMRATPALVALRRELRTLGTDAIVAIDAHKSYKHLERPWFYHDPDVYAGTLRWVGSHVFDLYRWLTGRDPERVRFQSDSERVMQRWTTGLVEGVVPMTFTLDYLRDEDARTHGDDSIRVLTRNGLRSYHNGHTSSGSRVLMEDDRLDWGAAYVAAACAAHVGAPESVLKEVLPHASSDDDVLASLSDGLVVDETLLSAINATSQKKELPRDDDPR
jgi:predicted dehydrogenase